MMIIEIFDRHAENVDPNVPLCPHETFNNVYWGNIVRVIAEMEAPGWIITSKLVKAEAEIEIHLISKKQIRIIINHADYLAAKKAIEEQNE